MTCFATQKDTAVFTINTNNRGPEYFEHDAELLNAAYDYLDIDNYSHSQTPELVIYNNTVDSGNIISYDVESKTPPIPITRPRNPRRIQRRPRAYTFPYDAPRCSVLKCQEYSTHSCLNCNRAICIKCLEINTYTQRGGNQIIHCPSCGELFIL